MEQVNIPSAAIILAIPDRVVQVINCICSDCSSVKIIGRAHLDLIGQTKNIRVDKIVQPEFEAAVEIARGILSSFSKPKGNRESIKRLKCPFQNIKYAFCPTKA